MNRVKQIAVVALLVVSFVSTAQQKNELHNRDFWKGNPDIAAVKQKISEGNNPTAFNDNAFDATTFALLGKVDVEVLKYLVSLEGNSIDKKTHDSRIYLHWAGYAGNVDLVKYLLDEGSSVTALDSHRYTPLAFAANAGSTNPVVYETFEKKGVNLANEKNNHGANLLLMVASSLENEKELDFFLSKGMELDSKDDDGNGIFNYASKKGNIDFLKLLVNKGVDYKSLNNKGGNAFLFATQGGRGSSNPLAVYDYLKSLGLEPNIVTKEGSTPLHRLASNNKDTAIFELFLSAGADVNQKDEEGNTPFLNAASRNELAQVKLLSKDVKDFNVANTNGQTALMLAVENNQADVVEFLLQNEADILVKDAKGNTLAYYLAESFDTRKTEAFDAKLKLLQEKGVAFNTAQSEGNILYHIAAKNNDFALLKRISDIDIDINTKNDDGLTALHLAAMKAENDEMLKYLISKGADTKVTTDFEETVYDLASENELLKNGQISLSFLK
ncbi:ankyrin repeat domain-containing protein [Maribacter sp. ACAM166]|uniref:ankyrin repeat domain-containing protein n=1 Tax=Maribacter sp. ACAM166 TaxID=2508996 RepID=UPI0010FF4C60|nr:ankyrin repeat domain-containing protein [Maribacter sp. ACAM166]TLP79774.1 ankyrin repeat domain-containing protein [Maribacter sp. ACAM166]